MAHDFSCACRIFLPQVGFEFGIPSASFRGGDGEFDN